MTSSTWATATENLSTEYNSGLRSAAVARVRSALASGSRREYIAGLRDLKPLVLAEEDYYTVRQAIDIYITTGGVGAPKTIATPWLLDLLARLR